MEWELKGKCIHMVYTVILIFHQTSNNGFLNLFLGEKSFALHNSTESLVKETYQCIPLLLLVLFFNVLVLKVIAKSFENNVLLAVPLLQIATSYLIRLHQ